MNAGKSTLLLQAAYNYQERGMRTLLMVSSIDTRTRRGEIASLTPASFELDASPATVRVPAGMSKNRKETLLPLHPAFVKQIRSWLGGRQPDAPCWPGTWTDRSSQMLQVDLAAGGIPYRDEAGKVFDFHALRHHMVTSLARNGVHPSMAKRLARHSTIELTMNTYTHLDLEEAAAALDQVDAGSLGLGLTLGPEKLTRQPTRTAASTSRCESSRDAESTGLDSDPCRGNSVQRSALDTPRPRESSSVADITKSVEEPANSFLNRRSQVRILSGVPVWR